MPPPEKPEDKIKRIVRDAAAVPSSTPKPKRAKKSISVTGNGNVVAGENVYQLHPVIRPKIEVKTGDGVIDAAQKADLTRRLKQWLAARNAVRKDKMTIDAAWAALNTSVDVNSYHEITPEKLPAALAWIKRNTAILSSMTSAPTKIEGFRGKMISAIKARAKQLGDDHFYTPHIVKTYGLSSLTHLSDKQLQEVRVWVMRQKR